MVFKIYALYKNHFEFKNCLEYIGIAILLIKHLNLYSNIFILSACQPNQSIQLKTLNDKIYSLKSTNKHKYHCTIFQKGLKLLSVQIYTCSGFPKKLHSRGVV